MTPEWEWNATRTCAVVNIGRYRLRVFRAFTLKWIGQVEYRVGCAIEVLHTSPDLDTTGEAERFAIAMLAEEVSPVAAWVIDPIRLEAP